MIEESAFQLLYSLLDDDADAVNVILSKFRQNYSDLQKIEIGELLVSLNNCGCLTKSQEFVSCLLLLFDFYCSSEDINPFWMHILSILDTVLYDVRTNYIYENVINTSTFEELSSPPSSILDNPQEIDSELYQQCRDRVYSRYKEQCVPLYLYVGAPYPLALSKQSSASLYERYLASSLSLYGMGAPLSACSHRQFHFTPLPCDYAPLFPQIPANFLLDPVIEQVSDSDMIVLYIRQLFESPSSPTILSFFESHQSSLRDVIRRHCEGELSVVGPSNILELVERWRDLGLAFLTAFLKSKRFNSTYFQLLCTMELTENRLVVVITLLLVDLLPASIFISLLINKLLELEKKERKELVPLFCRYVKMNLGIKGVIPEIQYDEIDSFCRECSDVKEAQELLDMINTVLGVC